MIGRSWGVALRAPCVVERGWSGMSKVRLGMWALLLVVAVGVWRVAAGMGQSQRTVHLSAVLYVGQRVEIGAYSVLGPPTVSASFIDRVLSAYRSPAAGLGSVI